MQYGRNTEQLAILMVGDVFGESGFKMLGQHLPAMKQKLRPDLIVVNGENAAGGIGLLPRQAQEMFGWGVDVISAGNHTMARQELYPLLEQEPHLLRPANWKEDAPGQGWVVARTRSGYRVAMVSLLGRALMPGLELACPFAALQNLLDGPLKNEKCICVDFHAEATSEKQALAWHFDGRISACIGSHTHVATADERVLPRGTAYLSDMGMTGPYNSVIGMDPATAINRFLKKTPPKFKVADGPAILNSVLITLDAQSGHALELHRITIS